MRRAHYLPRLSQETEPLGSSSFTIQGGVTLFARVFLDTVLQWEEISSTSKDFIIPSGIMDLLRSGQQVVRLDLGIINNGSSGTFSYYRLGMSNPAPTREINSGDPSFTQSSSNSQNANLFQNLTGVELSFHLNVV